MLIGNKGKKSNSDIMSGLIRRLAAEIELSSEKKSNFPNFSLCIKSEKQH
jgi:hypothetical protein